MAYEGLKVASDVSKRLAAQREKAGLPAACATSTPRAAATTTTPATRAGATTPAWFQVDLALKAERKRTEDVFASAASRGRERSAVIMLTGEPKTSAADIIARLSGLATDAHFAGVRSDASAATRQAAASAAWDRSYDRAFGKSPTPAPAAASIDPWDRAIAQLGKRA